MSLRTATILLVAGLALLASEAHAGGDCLARMGETENWSCHATLSNGESVDYCGELTHVFGVGAASRYFKTTSTGPYLASCTCQAKGKRGFGRDASYLCADRDTGTVIAAKVASRKLSGQTFNTTADVQSRFVCTPTPSCDVQDVIDAELEPENGVHALALGTLSLDLEVGGSVDLGYLAECGGGFASEAPTLVYDVAASPDYALSFELSGAGTQGVLVSPPSGGRYCHDGGVTFGTPESGPWLVWATTQAPASRIPGTLTAKLFEP
jgi:hypothetical protein